MREYNVILKEGIDYDGFWNDIESDTDGGNLYIPNRKVEFTNERPASLRQCWYLLTDEEAEQLKLDERVFDVEIPPEKRDDLKMVLRAVQRGDFTKTTSDAGSYLNWGMIRCNFNFNNYGASTNTTSSYEYCLTGNAIDVVIQDSGLEVNHPEFVEIDITGEIPKMSDKKIKEETTQPNETTETILPKKKNIRKNQNQNNNDIPSRY